MFSPIVILYAFIGLNMDLSNILIIFLMFVLLSSSRLRFSLLRTTDNVVFSEVPDQILRPAIIILCAYIFCENSLEKLFIFAFLGIFISAISSFLLAKNYYQLVSISELKNHSDFKKIV